MIWRVVAVLGAVLLAGFAWFLVLIARPVPDRPHAQGIVVLTGGARRVRMRLRLLRDGDARWLLVSGIGGGADLAALGRRAGFDPLPLAPRITLGRGAASTFGNAREAAAWVKEKRLRSVILVTAFYHIPRAMLEFRRAMPGLRLVPYPVRPRWMRHADGLGRWAGVRVLGEEYMKLLAAELGLSALFPGPGPILTPAGT